MLHTKTALHAENISNVGWHDYFGKYWNQYCITQLLTLGTACCRSCCCPSSNFLKPACCQTAELVLFFLLTKALSVLRHKTRASLEKECKTHISIILLLLKIKLNKSSSPGWVCKPCGESVKRDQDRNTLALYSKPVSSQWLSSGYSESVVRSASVRAENFLTVEWMCVWGLCSTYTPLLLVYDLASAAHGDDSPVNLLRSGCIFQSCCSAWFCRLCHSPSIRLGNRAGVTNIILNPKNAIGLSTRFYVFNPISQPRLCSNTGNHFFGCKKRLWGFLSVVAC